MSDLYGSLHPQTGDTLSAAHMMAQRWNESFVPSSTPSSGSGRRLDFPSLHPSQNATSPPRSHREACTLPPIQSVLASQQSFDTAQSSVPSRVIRIESLLSHEPAPMPTPTPSKPRGAHVSLATQDHGRSGSEVDLIHREFLAAQGISPMMPRDNSAAYSKTGCSSSIHCRSLGRSMNQLNACDLPPIEPTSRSSMSPVTSVPSSIRGGHGTWPTLAPRATKPQIEVPASLNYQLSIRQQADVGRACGYGDRDRRTIDPPPIIELKITDRATGAPQQDPNGLLALHCTLMSESGKNNATDMPHDQPDGRVGSRLMGTLVASPYQAKDEHGVPGTFFVFPDISCRRPGRYRLRFRLLRVDPTNVLPGTSNRCVGDVLTGPLTVFTPKDFPGMKESTALLKALRRQGLNVGVKKGSEARNRKARKVEQPVNSDIVEERRNDPGTRLSPGLTG